MDDRSGARLVRLGDSGQMLANPAEDIRGYRVHDQDGEEIGKIDELLIDEDEGRVRMVRIEEGGFLGIGSTPFFLPVDVITSIADGEVHVDQTRSRVAEAPRYDPDLTDQSDYYSELYDYYGYPPYWGPGYIYGGFPFAGRM
jgi:sporulation protein YlmC with PRC-barrel domain